MSRQYAPPPLPPKKGRSSEAATGTVASSSNTPNHGLPGMSISPSMACHHNHMGTVPRPQSCPRQRGGNAIWNVHCIHTTCCRMAHMSHSVNYCCAACHGVTATCGCGSNSTTNYMMESMGASLPRQRSSTTTNGNASGLAFMPASGCPCSHTCSHFLSATPGHCCLHSQVSPCCCCNLTSADWGNMGTSSSRNSPPNLQRRQHMSRRDFFPNKGATPTASLPTRLWRRMKNLFRHRSPSATIRPFYCQECGGHATSSMGRPSRLTTAPPLKPQKKTSMRSRPRSNSYIETSSKIATSSKPGQLAKDNLGFDDLTLNAVPSCDATSCCRTHTCAAQPSGNFERSLSSPSDRVVRRPRSATGDGPTSEVFGVFRPTSSSHTPHASQPAQPQKLRSEHPRPDSVSQRDRLQRNPKSSFFLPPASHHRHSSSTHYPLHTTNSPHRRATEVPSSSTNNKNPTMSPSSSFSPVTVERPDPSLTRSRTVPGDLPPRQTSHATTSSSSSSRPQPATTSSQAGMITSLTPPIVQPRPHRVSLVPTSTAVLLTEATHRAGESRRALVEQHHTPHLSPTPVATSTNPESTLMVTGGDTGLVTSAQLVMQQRLLSFLQTINQLKKMGWYWGPLTMEEANLLLAERKDGTFLVRDSCHEAYILSLSLRAMGETFHTRIEHHAGEFSFWTHSESHRAATIVEFIEKAVEHSHNGRFQYFMQTNVAGQPPNQVTLLYPLSRFQVVFSLKHICRFEILSHVRRDHIMELTLPPSLKEYLSEKQYFAEHLNNVVEVLRDKPPLAFVPYKVRLREERELRGEPCDDAEDEKEKEKVEEEEDSSSSAANLS